MVSVAVTGGHGMLGTALRDYFPQADFLSRQSCDVGNPGSVRQWFSHHRYDLILHLAAETRYDAAPEALCHVNVSGTANVLQWARKQGARFLYASTDYCGARRETDPVAPVGEYGRSKVAGELVALSYGSTVAIRGSWYAALLYTRAATDAYTSKIPVAKAAAQIAQVALSTATGIVNIGGPRRSLYEITTTEFNPRCQPCLRADVHLPYSLPADVSLDLTRFHQIAGC